MSHFTVLVIGPDPETQLEPYDENIEVPAYDRGEVSQDEMDRMIKYYVAEKGFEYKNNFAELYKKHGSTWNGRCWRQHTDGTWHEWSTYNPKSKWDWYQLGGRWNGFFQLKEGLVGKVGEPGIMTKKATAINRGDQCVKGDIDFESMRAKAEKEAGESYDAAMEIFGDLPVNKTWEEIRGDDKANDTLRDVYWAQPRCVAWKKDDKTMEKFGWMSSPDMFVDSREKYIQQARDAAVSTFALVKDGKWYEKGEMGWWAMTSNEMDERDWCRFFNNTVDELSDDTLLSIFDCHI